MNNQRVLKVTKQEPLPDGIRVFRTDDGTVYYWKDRSYSDSAKLYVNWQGKDIHVDVPEGNYCMIAPHGKELYIALEKEIWQDIKIYKAMFTPSVGIVLSFVRDTVKGEESHCNGILVRSKDNVDHAYRLWEDPHTDGILINDMNELPYSASLEGVTGEKVIYLNHEIGAEVTARKLGEECILITVPTVVRGVFWDQQYDYSGTLYIRDSSPLIYISGVDEFVHVLSIQTMEFLQPLEFESSEFINSVIGIHNEEIVAIGKINDKKFTITALLPREYVTTRIVNEPVVLKKVEEHDKESDTSIANNSLEYLLDQCCCSICSENYDSTKIIPLNLDCGHSFCQVCIHNDNMRVNNEIKCPNCETVTSLPDGKILPKNYGMLSMSDQLMRARVDPKVTCKECNMKFSSSSVRLCTKEDCSMFNQLICLNCTIDGGHAGHAVKYDVKVEKIRKELREEVNVLCSKIDEKKNMVLDKKEQLTELIQTIEKDAEDYKEIVNDLAKTIIDQCDSLIESFDAALNTANASLRSFVFIGLALLADKSKGDEEDLQMSDDDPRSKRGGHHLFDHSSFPDAVILRVHGQNFIVSASYLSLHSSYFHELFYGANGKGLNERAELDCDPRTFGDLLDLIYPCYKKTDCCVECTTSAQDRLNLATKLRMPFAISRLQRSLELVNGSTKSVPVSARFPDAATVTVRGVDILVSASTLSLHSSVLRDLLYKDGKLVKEIELDMDRRSFYTFIRATTGVFPTELSSLFLDILLILQAQSLYDFYLSEIEKKIANMSKEDSIIYHMELLNHYETQPTPEISKMKSTVRNLNIEDLNDLLSKCNFISIKSKQEMMKKQSAHFFQIKVKDLRDVVHSIYCDTVDTIVDLKAKIQYQIGTPSCQQRLIFKGMQLEDGRTLGDYGLEEKSIINMALKISGC